MWHRINAILRTLSLQNLTAAHLVDCLFSMVLDRDGYIVKSLH
jgi:hypothetical protein